MSNRVNREVKMAKGKAKAEDSSELKGPGPTDHIVLGRCEILVKESHLTSTVKRMGVEIVDDLQKCMFCMVLRVGRRVKDKKNLAPGKVILIHKSAGKRLEGLNGGDRMTHFVVDERDVVAFIAS